MLAAPHFSCRVPSVSRWTGQVGADLCALSGCVSPRGSSTGHPLVSLVSSGEDCQLVEHLCCGGGSVGKGLVCKRGKLGSLHPGRSQVCFRVPASPPGRQENPGANWPASLVKLAKSNEGTV